MIPFGKKYLLIELLGTGGMAEVYRGKLLGEEGFEKQVVIKKLLDEHTANRELVQVFIGEAKLAALLQHDNIAETYDFGQTNDHYFLAMEYLAGQDLFTVLQRAKEKQSFPTIEKTLMIVSKICDGMEYAHNLTDLKNKPLHLVHRDLTPHNIFLTYDGKVKIIDFGIARAELTDNKTKAGVVKGKISYMSPEQLTGEKIDKRSDIFSIGILLYEMVSNRRMYTGDTGELIRKCITVEYEQLEEINPDLPQGLYRIVHKALAKNVEERYQTCSELQADIDDLLFSLEKRPDIALLKQYIRDLFPVEFEKEKQTHASIPGINSGVSPDANAAKISFGSSDSLEELDEKTAIYTDIDTTLQEERALLVPSSATLTKRTKIFLAVAANCLLFLLLIFFIIPEDKKESPSKETAVIRSGLELQIQADTVKKEQKKLNVKELLNKAHDSLQENRLLPPANNSAYQYYNEVLSINPENKVALDGLRQIGDTYATMAESALLANQYKNAEELIQKGRIAAPAYQRLQMVDDRIQREKQQQISTWANQASRCLQENKLTTPENDSAVLYYRKILNIDVESIVAREGMLKVADRYLALAGKEYKRFDFTTARYFIEKGLSVAPEHKGLLDLQQELTKSKPELFLKTLGRNLDSLFSK